MEDGRWKVEEGGWRVKDGRWKVEEGGCWMEGGGWRVVGRGWTVVGSGWEVVGRGERRTGSIVISIIINIKHSFTCTTYIHHANYTQYMRVIPNIHR